MLAGEYYLSVYLVEENREHVVDQRLRLTRFKVTFDGIEKGIFQPDVKWQADGKRRREPPPEFGPNLAFEDDEAAAIAALGIKPADRVLEVGGASKPSHAPTSICDLTFGATSQRNGVSRARSRRGSATSTLRWREPHSTTASSTS